VIPSAEGYLACGDTGSGKLPEPAVLIDYVEQEIACEKDLAGKKVLVTAGPTQEALDPVRYLTNHSSGKMGYAIAIAAARRGAEVTLVSGPTALPAPLFVKYVPIKSAQDMFEAVTAAAPEQDIIIKAAAVADYRPVTVADEKMKKKDEDLSIPLERTQDILKYLGAHRREGQFLCGFSMETEHMLENSRRKLESKKIDMIAANNVKVKGAGFAVDTNVLTLITPDTERELPLLTKEEAAMRLLDAILERIR
ncbi:MAG: bifunctional phosphopantothenoylcysteine decarboxylase/phosphopantothenate--cysteine ligase CoaBC, partial [Lachnospiraceae bacterium]|nr:bifunctional phosphopantothenoylcysteine decarboxylase/phosphopantothenate--cysteine ligase CoaBC [Lachnospiraceae bacterium]